MHEASFAFFRDLLRTPSPSGFERPIQNVVRAWATPLADEVRTDRHGNVIAALNPGGSPRIMLAGHCDQLGLMVEYVDENGFLYVQPIGGWDMQVLLGQNLVVWTKDGPVNGVVARKAPHLLTPEERKKVPDFPDVWVDIGARDRAQAEARVALGDPVTVDLGGRELLGDCYTAPGLDDKVGVWAVMEALRLLKDRPLKAAVFCVSTVQEEIGLRGATTSAYGIAPTVGVAVDVCHAADTPGTDKKSLGDTRLGNGPVAFRGPNINPHVHAGLVDAASRLTLPLQVRGVAKATGTDANAIQLSRDGVAAGLVGIPNRYMHSPVEVVNLADLDAAARILADFCASIGPGHDWTP